MTVKELIEGLQAMPQDLEVAALTPYEGKKSTDDDVMCYPIGDIEHVDADSKFVCLHLAEED